MKAFFGKIWAWIVAHKLISGIIAGAFVAVLTVSIVVPVSVSASKKRKAAEQESHQTTPSGDQGGEAQGGGGTPSAPEEFTVVWKDGSGKVLETDNNVKKGSMPVFNGEVPNDPISYESETYKVFKAWDKEFAPVTADVTYTATYEERPYNGEFPKVNSTGTKVKYGMYPQHVIQPSNLEDTLNDEMNAGAPQLDTLYDYEGKYYIKTAVTALHAGRTYEGITLEVNTGDELWFTCEPIEWKVLSSENNRYKLFANIGLENKIFAENAANSNNYSQSLIRNWLNNEFYHMAFDLGNSNLQVTEVDNSAASTGDPENPHACDNTQDKVYLLSVAEVADDGIYGFTDDSRKISVTDYCLAHNGYIANNNTRITAWSLRSPREATGNSLDNRRIKFINQAGHLDAGMSSTQCSVAPAIEILID